MNHDETTTTLTIHANPLTGSGPETIIDNYTISFTLTPLSHASSNVVTSFPWNVTLAHNEIYSITIVAVNCAGESVPYIISDIHIGMHIILCLIVV